jgi:hypothetical protein
MTLSAMTFSITALSMMFAILSINDTQNGSIESIYAE